MVPQASGTRIRVNTSTSLTNTQNIATRDVQSSIDVYLPAEVMTAPSASGTQIPVYTSQHSLDMHPALGV